MKSLAITLLLCCSLTFGRAAPANELSAEKEEQYLQECNSTSPIQRDPQLVIASSIATGELFTLSHEEQCVLLCFLQKIKFVNEQGNIRNGSTVAKYFIKQTPALAKYSDSLISSIFQIHRSTKRFSDKCVKAQIIYHRLVEQMFIFELADGLQESTGVREKIVNAVENDQAVEPDVSKQVKEYFTSLEKLASNYAKEVANEQSQQQGKILI